MRPVAADVARSPFYNVEGANLCFTGVFSAYIYSLELSDRREASMTISDHCCGYLSQVVLGATFQRPCTIFFGEAKITPLPWPVLTCITLGK